MLAQGPTGNTDTVSYSPGSQSIQGVIPFARSYPLTITAPDTLTGAATVLLTSNIAVTSAPAGVSNTTALSYLSFSQSSVTFSGASQTITVTVTMTVPANAVAGGYGYQIYASGWPTGTAANNNGTAINATVSLPANVGAPPSVVISTPTDLQAFSFAPTAFPAQIPLSFTGTAVSAHPILSVDANLTGPSVNGAAITVTGTSTTANATVTATGNMTVSQPGTYIVQARASNDGGTSATSNTFTVSIAGTPPTVSISSPTPSQIFTIPAGSTQVAVPFTFAGSSTYGAISSLTATLNGTSFTAFTTTGLNTLAVSGSAPSVSLAAGTYTLVTSATNPYGTASAQTTFKVVSATPPPTLALAISKPVDGSIITRVAGSPATAVPFAINATETNGTVSTLTATLGNGTTTVPVTFTPTGLTTTTAAGSGNLSISAAGTYTLTATATGTGGLTTTSSVKFTVKETQPAPQPCTTKVLWLQPLADGKVQSCSNSVSVAFEIQKCCPSTSSGSTSCGGATWGWTSCGWGWGGWSWGGWTWSQTGCSWYGADNDDDDDNNCNSWNRNGDTHNRFCPSSNDWADHSGGDCQVPNTNCTLAKDTSVYVSIYEVFPNCTTGTPSTYSYSSGYVGNNHYSISANNIYKLSFTPGSGKHRYRIEIDNFASGSSTPTLIGTREFTTQ